MLSISIWKEIPVHNKILKATLLVTILLLAMLPAVSANDNLVCIIGSADVTNTSGAPVDVNLIIAVIPSGSEGVRLYNPASQVYTIGAGETANVKGSALATVRDGDSISGGITTPSGSAAPITISNFSIAIANRKDCIGGFFDGRVNNNISKDVAAPVAVYTDPFVVRAIDPFTGDGHVVMTLSDNDLNVDQQDTPVIVAEALNPFTNSPITLYRLPTGEYQINTFQTDGKLYAIIWNSDFTESYHPE